MSEFRYPLSVPMIGDEETEAAVAVLRSGFTTMGERVEEFEEAFARHVGSRYAVMVNSGSSADLLMAFAARHGQNDKIWTTPEVLIPVVTWPTHVWAFVHAGWNVRFVDVDGLNTTPAIINEERQPWTGMVSLVHLMGVPCDTDGLDGLSVTEDCCEALGASVGNAGEMATWSFFFSHHITTMEGGMVTTDQPELASLLRSLRSHGWMRHDGGDPYTFVNPGFNVRPTEISAAIGLVQLGRLEEFNKLRAENRQAFVDALSGCPGIEFPAVPGGATPSWFGLPFFVEERRDDLAAHLEANGVETRPILGGNLARQPAFQGFSEYGYFPGADRVHDHGLYVGLHPQSDSGVERVAELVRGFLCA